jgi:superfamily II DNA or RNA helicase
MSSDSMTKAQLTAQILEAFEKFPVLTAKQIAASIGVHKTAVNPILYGDAQFQNLGGTPPKWRLHSNLIVTESAKQKVGRPSAAERDGVLNKIVGLLLNRTGQSAHELAEELSLERAEVNSVLYAATDTFVHRFSSPPLWYLVIDKEIPDEEVEEEDEIVEPEPLDPEALKRFIKRDPPARIVPTESSSGVSDHFSLYEWQAQALVNWRANNYRGIANAVTGAGKSRLALAAIRDLLAEGGKCVVVVPTVVLLKQWAELIEDALPQVRVGRAGNGRDDDLNRHDVVVTTVATARQRTFSLPPQSVGLLVADECHRTASEMNKLALDERFIRRLGLSATHERPDGAHDTVLLPYFDKVIYELGYDAAIGAGVVAQVRVAFVGVDFTAEEAERYAVLVKQLSKLRKTLIREYGCRPAPFAVFLDDVIRLRGGTMKAGIAANRWLSGWREKRNLLAETPAKIDALRHMAPILRDADRSLIFTQSIASATSLNETLVGATISSEVHHSQVDTAERSEVMERFSAGDTKALVSVQTLEEGVDVPDADLAVIIAASKQQRQMIQRMGRVMRRKSDGRDARFVIVFVRDTDEDPRLGAHAAFVDDLVGVARESDLFDLPEQVDEFREFLRPDRF